MADNSIPQVSPIVIKKITRCDVTFEVSVITEHCIVLKSLKTGKTAQFTSRTALNNFLAQWEFWHGYKQAQAA